MGLSSNSNLHHAAYKALNRLCKSVYRNRDGRIPSGASEIRQGSLCGERVDRLCVVLGGQGCTWYRKTAGCFMCNYPHKCPTRLIPPKKLERILVSNFRTQVSRHEPTYKILCIYNSGSFFCDEEVLPGARWEILREAAQLPQVQRIIVESRCEYVTAETIAQAAQTIAPKQLVVGVGLESSSDFVRNRILLKGLSRRQFECASAAIGAKASLMVYLLFGAPVLTERERISNALTSIQYARKCGAKTITLQVCNIQPWSALEWLWLRGIYRPPWLWSVHEVIGVAPAEVELLLAGREGTPVPLQSGWNCAKCSEHVWSQFEAFNVHQDKSLLQMPDCKCREEWRRTIQAEDHKEPLRERLLALQGQIKAWLSSEKRD